MFFHLISVFAAGACAAGLVMLVYRTMGRKAPRFLLPLVAGLAMIGFNAWSEYTWHSRTASALPDHIKVVQRYGHESAWQPWTLLFPRIDRLLAVDTSQTKRNEKLPDHVLAEILLVHRYDPTAVAYQMFDCKAARRTDVDQSKGFGADGLPVGANWMPVERDSGLFRTLCAS